MRERQKRERGRRESGNTSDDASPFSVSSSGRHTDRSE